jgi:hypothetical protein
MPALEIPAQLLIEHAGPRLRQLLSARGVQPICGFFTSRLARLRKRPPLLAVVNRHVVVLRSAGIGPCLLEGQSLAVLGDPA